MYTKEGCSRLSYFLKEINFSSELNKQQAKVTREMLDWQFAAICNEMADQSQELISLNAIEAIVKSHPMGMQMRAMFFSRWRALFLAASW